jgi:glycosyltransferase involved in cell wall biosynthesis
MHVLYVHQNFPAQFGHIAHHLAGREGWRATFLSETPAGRDGAIEKIQYKRLGGATAQNHFCSRTFENTVWHCDAAFRALAERPDLKPDLIVGHSGFGSTLFLRELYPDVPVVNLFEYYYLPHDVDSDMDFRTDLAALGWTNGVWKYQRSRCRNAMILLDLQNCQLGYCPTAFQRSRFPDEYAGKLDVMFDGIDRTLWHGHDGKLRPPPSQRTGRTIAGVEVAADEKLVTYVSRGFESMRGFDIFMKSARRITERDPKVRILVVGTERIAYGGDEGHTDGQSFKAWTLAQAEFQGADLSRIHFVGRLPPAELATVLASTDLHIYLTVPFVLSWSMVNAMSCGAVVLGSDTPPVRELIEDGETGLLADFFDPDEFADAAMVALADIPKHRHLGEAAEALVREKYALDAVLPRMLEMYEKARATTAGLEPPRPWPEVPKVKPTPPPQPARAAKPALPAPTAAKPGGPFAG